jgi:hypothetical protein
MAEDDLLDGLLAEAAARPSTLPDGLMARILSDADALQPRPRPVPVAQPAPASRGWLANLADWFGGGFALAGMSAAAVSGLYLGLAQPASILALSDALAGGTVESLDLLPDLGSNWVME